MHPKKIFSPTDWTIDTKPRPQKQESNEKFLCNWATQLAQTLIQRTESPSPDDLVFF